MKYLPFLSGKYTTAPGLTPMSKATSEHDKLVFQIDETYQAYLDNKRACRQENIGKYYLEAKLPRDTQAFANKYLAEQLVREYPQQFRLSANSLLNIRTGEELHWQNDWISVNQPYRSLFDALCSQVQEDVAIVQLDNDPATEYLAAIHLCAPNHWSPAEKIGQPFARIHEPVPDMERVLQGYWKMFSSIVTSRGPFTRFAWGMATDTRLNHHPEPPAGTDVATWQGRVAHSEDQKFFIRTERQNLVGFPEVNALLFTIRTYFYDVDELTPDEKTTLIAALESMSPEVRRYKGVVNTMPQIIFKLSRA